MSKKTKEKSKLKRRAERGRAKAARVALYNSYKLAGNNSKRSRKSRKVKAPGHPHLLPDCGNIGCLRCSKIAILGKIRLLQASGNKLAIDRFLSKIENMVK